MNFSKQKTISPNVSSKYISKKLTLMPDPRTSLRCDQLPPHSEISTNKNIIHYPREI